MQIIFIFIASIVILAAYFVSGSSQPNQETVLQQNNKANVVIKTDTTQAPEPSAPFLIDTYITAGPVANEVIEKTNKVTFKFEGVTSQAIKSKISYETKVEGFNTKWQSTDSGERTIEFPAGNKQYTFFVRTKTDGYYDTTPAQVTFFVKTSSNFGQIKISGVSSDKVTLRAVLKENEKIDITGWKVVGKGGEFTIPQGIELYPGYFSPNSDIFIKSGEQIYIKSDNSPFWQNNAFLTNKCFGYLASSGSSFPFSTSRICPSIKREEICNFSQACQSAILSLQNCRPVDNSKLSSLTYDSICQTYMENYANKNLNYSGCVGNYLKDDNFFGKIWYIYAGFSPSCKCGEDAIYLYDNNGLLVDKYEYERYN
jgi:hypothetical protein